MGQISAPEGVLLILAAFSRHGEALDFALQRSVETWGAAPLVSPRFDFAETEYYEPTMGPGLVKQFFAFERPADPASLPAIKQATNAWEEEYALGAAHAEPRPLNLDPGYLTLAKLVLASTKDHAHRIYLREGIFAEVTLTYKARCWRPHPWTFPDYRRADYQAFFDECRGYYRRRLRPN